MRCYCPDDCNCHYPWRQNFCGCRQHGPEALRPDLAKYVNSTRHALTWDDVQHRETTGRPYPKKA